MSITVKDCQDRPYWVSDCSYKRGSDGHPASRRGAMTVADVAAAAGRNRVPLGIAYMVGSAVMFAGGNAVVKWQLATYPLGGSRSGARCSRS